tara:strand:+ start:1896 stop:5234 length:3339 start_codon:yes stop_codon:yes gene_type:complete
MFYIPKINRAQSIPDTMRNPSKSVFVSVFIVITLVGMSLSAISNNQNQEIQEEETKFFSHTNINFEGYQEDSIYSYSTLSSGGYTNCVITEDQRVVCWGSNDQGKRGLGGGIDNASVTPVGKAGPWVVGNLSGGMVEVSSGGWSACSLKQTGEIWCWGGGEYGQLGSGNDLCQGSTGSLACQQAQNHPPVKVSLPLGRTAVSLSDANQGHFCAILDNGDGICWGWNENGQLGDGTVCTGGSYWQDNSNPTPAGCNSKNGRYTPAVIDDSNFPANSSFISISMGQRHSCGIIDNNDLYCWGQNNYGQLGIGLSDFQNYPTPQFVASNVIAVGTGDQHSCALYENQNVKCWGQNNMGQLGTGDNYLYSSPQPINLSTNILLISLESAYNSNCVITEEFETYCWGTNYFSQLGNQDGDGTQENPLLFWNTEYNFTVNTTAAMSINGDGVCQIIGQSSDNSTHNHRDVFCNGQSYRGQMGDGNWNQSFGDWNWSFVNLSSDNIGPLTYQGAGGVHISERDIDNDSIISILDNLPNGCPDGSFDPNYDGSCVIADAGYFSTNLMYNEQLPCDLGTYQPHSGQSSCIDSSPGHFVDSTSSTSQQACLSGTYQPNTGQSSCIDASPGHEINLNSTAQIMCSLGDYQSESGQQNCIPASPGYHVPNLGSLSQTGCEPGTYQPNFGASSCFDASLGYFVEGSNATMQEACSPGTYQPNFGSTSCEIASPGYYVDTFGSSLEEACSVGTYNPSSGSDDISDCLITDPGNYVDYEGAVTQSECPMGTFNPNSNSITSNDCLSADSGHYVENTGSSEQTPCEVGYYQPSTGQTFCLESSSGTYVPNTGSSSAMDCLAGTYQPDSGQDTCLDAEAGYFTSADRASSQMPCLAGSYQSEIGSTSCIQSDSGYHVPSEGQAMQTICPAGQYQPQPGSSECMITNPGEYSSEGATSPSPCLPGSYQSQSGQSGCVLADSGYYSSDISSTEQTSCQPGEYQPLTGQSSCIPAARGHYVDSAAATEEIPCNIGSYQPFMGMTECMLSSINNYVASPGMAGQTVCPSGESQPLTGQASCNVDSEDSGVSPYLLLIGGVVAVALVIVGLMTNQGSKNKAKRSGKKRRKMKKK